MNKPSYCEMKGTTFFPFGTKCAPCEKCPLRERNDKWYSPPRPGCERFAALNPKPVDKP